jgi:pimeloyl-ACP methyl ester carboxylesterase
MSKWIGWIVIALGALILAAVIVTAGAGMVDAQATENAVQNYSPRGQFVEVNGAQMHVICQGEGERTLVLQAGIGGGALDWLPLMEQLEDDFRVCAFDRLGQDWSDPAPTQRTFGDAADELNVALTALGIEHPIVVGHSLGGAVAQIYAGRYDVDGLVLVDGLSLGATPEVTKRLGTYQHLDWAGRLGLLRPLGSLMADGAYPDELRAEMKALRSRSSTLLEFSAEGAVAARTATEDLADSEPNISAPLLVIAAGDSELPEGEIFLQSLRDLASRHDGSTFQLIPDARHYVIASHAQLVAAAIEEWAQSINME